MRTVSTHLLARHRTAGWLVPVVLLSAVAATSSAQEIGTVAAVDGSVELVRAGSRIPVTIGTPINTGDEIQSGKPGRAVFVFDDDSVLITADNSRIRIDEHEFRRGAATIRSRLQLSQGKVRALVSEYYRAANATYEIQSPTALASVQGTEFVMAYDPVAEVTDVVGVTSTVRVQSPIGRAARGAVLVSPQELTTVAQGQLPTPPRSLPDVRFRGYLDGLEFIGEGRAVSLATGVLAGKTVPPPEKAQAAVAPFAVRGEPGDLPVRPETPGDIMGEPLPGGYYGPTGLGDVGVNF